MFHKQNAPVGARPGTLNIPKESPAPKITSMVYRPESVDENDLAEPPDPGAIQSGDRLWIDVQGLGDEAMLLQISELYGIHPLALEDVVHIPQRPKTQAYDTHQMYVTHMVRLEDDKIVWDQMSLFFNEDYVLTFQEKYGDVLDPVRKRMRQGLGPMRKSSGSYLAYAIIDAVVDGYYPVMETLADRVESLEDRIIRSSDPHILSEMNEVKRLLLDIRRSIWPQRDAINELIRDASHVTKKVGVYFRDVYDHIVQLMDVIESLKEVVSGLLSTYLSVVANRTNDVMKVLTIMASIFIPLTFLAGIYGMNFEYIPELKFKWGYPVLLAIMFVITAAMVVYFWRKRWIGPDAGSETPPD